MIFNHNISEPYYTLLKYKVLPYNITSSSYEDIKKDDIIIFTNNLFGTTRTLTFLVK